jgi:hypothetical protein
MGLHLYDYPLGDFWCPSGRTASAFDLVINGVSQFPYCAPVQSSPQVDCWQYGLMFLVLTLVPGCVRSRISYSRLSVWWFCRSYVAGGDPIATSCDDRLLCRFITPPNHIAKVRQRLLKCSCAYRKLVLFYSTPHPYHHAINPRPQKLNSSRAQVRSAHERWS